MGKFERAYRKKFKQQAPPFGEWSDKHGDRLPQTAPQDAVQGAVRAKRRLPAWIWVAAGGVLLLLALTSAYLLHNRSQTGEISDLTFGDKEVYSVKMNADDHELCQKIIPNLASLIITDNIKMVRRDDDSLVMLMEAGEMQTNDDFYLINVRFVFNKYFVLSDAEQFLELDEHTEINGTKISYELRESNQNPKYEYYVVSEHKDVTVYWTVSSMFGQFDEWLQLTFAA